MQYFLRIAPVLAILSAVLIISCGEPASFPRPFGFHRIEIPVETSYKTFEANSCPFSFEYPDFATISREESDSCWVDIQFKEYACKWHVSYRNVEGKKKDRNYHFEAYRRMIYNHNKKATEIRANPIRYEAGYGTVFELYGEVGIPVQFFLSDTSDQEIVMLSCYFNTALENDSLSPVIDYMKQEIGHVLETIEWNK